jgi:putative toxin-antitoxin system antitoxin component (TIGR02293 family)
MNRRTSEPTAGVALGRFAAILMALDDLYELKEALLWCESPQALLGGRRPINLLTTDQGALEVAAVVARLRDGAFI